MPPASVFALGFDVDELAAMLAMDGIRIVAGKPAMGTGDVDLGGPEDGLQEPQKEGDPEDHHGHRQQPAALAGERDVAEAGGRQRGDGEIERVDVVLDLRVGLVLQDEDGRGRQEDEDDEVGHRVDDLLVAAHPGRVAAQHADDVVGAQDAEGAQDAQKAEIVGEGGADHRDDDDRVGDRQRLEEERDGAAVDVDPGHEVGEEDDAEAELEGHHPVGLGDEGELDEQRDGDDVDGEHEPAKARRRRLVAVIEAPQAFLQRR